MPRPPRNPSAAPAMIGGVFPDNRGTNGRLVVEPVNGHLMLTINEPDGKSASFALGTASGKVVNRMVADFARASTPAPAPANTAPATTAPQPTAQPTAQPKPR